MNLDFYDDKICYPKKCDIYRCFNYFNLNDTKVVILGQDPYHNGSAIGLSFGIDGNKLPSSLRNIKRELKDDLNIELVDYTLENWAKQGVLLLNTSLTVENAKPGSHIKFWKDYIQNIIKELKQNEKIIWVAWGAHADKMIGDVPIKIVSSHPSGFSYKRPYKTYPSFSGSKPFSKINTLLDIPIIWDN